jgi:hypothetical protein
VSEPPHTQLHYHGLKGVSKLTGTEDRVGLGPERGHQPIEPGPGERPAVREEADGCGGVSQAYRQRARFFDFGPGRLNGGCVRGRCFWGG